MLHLFDLNGMNEANLKDLGSLDRLRLLVVLKWLVIGISYLEYFMTVLNIVKKLV